MENKNNIWRKVKYLNLNGDNEKHNYYVTEIENGGGFDYMLDIQTKEGISIRRTPITKDEIEFLD